MHFADLQKWQSALDHYDSVAIAGLRATPMLGRWLPEEVAVVGYDDVAMAQYVTPAFVPICNKPMTSLEGRDHA